jgi:hypothetical protein
MKGESLRIEIDEQTDEVTVLSEGFVGKGCSAVQDAISRDLGTVVEQKTTPEYHATTTRKKNLSAGR